MDNDTEVGLLVSLCIAIRIGDVHKAIPRLLAQAKSPQVRGVLSSLANLNYNNRAAACLLALPGLEQQLLG